jgi:hypothetical protein
MCGGGGGSGDEDYVDVVVAAAVSEAHDYRSQHVAQVTIKKILKKSGTIHLRLFPVVCVCLSVCLCLCLCVRERE